MKNTQLQKKAQIIADEISSKLVDYNFDLLQSVAEENFEQASLIQTTINLFLANSAQVLAQMTGGSIDEIFNGLKANSDLIFDEMKANESNLMK